MFKQNTNLRSKFDVCANIRPTLKTLANVCAKSRPTGNQQTEIVCKCETNRDLLGKGFARVGTNHEAHELMHLKT